MRKSKNSFFIEFSFVGKHLHTKFQKILSNGLDSANFLHFLSIFAVFLAKKCENRKIVFLLNFLLLGSIYIPNFRNFIKWFGFCQFSSFLVNFGCFFGKKCQNQKIVFLEFSFVRKHLRTKFQKILPNGLDLPIFSFFVKFGCFFGKKMPKIEK
jgi:hypothetical protein